MGVQTDPCPKLVCKGVGARNCHGPVHTTTPTLQLTHRPPSCPSFVSSSSAVFVDCSPSHTMNRQSSVPATSLHQRLEGATDLAKLSPVSDDILVACLRERFMTDNIYTSIGTSVLVAFNPHKYVASNADSVLHKYAAEYRETSDRKQTLPPHIFQLANNAYYHMRRTSQDQAIVLRCAHHPFVVLLVC